MLSVRLIYVQTICTHTQHYNLSIIFLSIQNVDLWILHGYDNICSLQTSFNKPEGFLSLRCSQACCLCQYSTHIHIMMVVWSCTSCYCSDTEKSHTINQENNISNWKIKKNHLLQQNKLLIRCCLCCLATRTYNYHPQKTKIGIKLRRHNLVMAVFGENSSLYKERKTI